TTAYAEERLDRCQGGRRVARLVRPVQRQEDLRVVAPQAGELHQLATDRDGPPAYAEIRPGPEQPRADRSRLLGQHPRRSGRLRAADHRGTRADDAGLLPRDRLDGVAEDADMV